MFILKPVCAIVLTCMRVCVHDCSRKVAGAVRFWFLYRWVVNAHFLMKIIPSEAGGGG